MSKYDKTAVIPFDQWLEWSLTKDDSLVDWKIYSRLGLPPCYGNHPLAKPIYAQYALRVWEQPREYLLDRFSMDQIVEYLYDPIQPDYQGEMRDRSWAALRTLFEEVFLPNVSDSLGHKSQINPSTKLLDTICYMWWELRTYRPKRGSKVNDEHFLNFCKYCCDTGKPTIQKSAIHGLGHSVQGKSRFPGARRLLQCFIDNGLAANPELNRYARIALSGEML